MATNDADTKHPQKHYPLDDLPRWAQKRQAKSQAPAPPEHVEHNFD